MRDSIDRYVSWRSHCYLESNLGDYSSVTPSPLPQRHLGLPKAIQVLLVVFKVLNVLPGT